MPLLINGDATMAEALPPEKEFVRYSLRVPPNLYEVFGEAVELGLIDKTKSRNQALQSLIQDRLLFLYAVHKMFEEARKELENASNVPQYQLQLKIATKALEDPHVQDYFFRLMAETIFAMAPLLDRPEFHAFIEKLKTQVEGESSVEEEKE